VIHLDDERFRDDSREFTNFARDRLNFLRPSRSAFRNHTSIQAAFQGLPP
jgi:hypothetical protein